MQVDDLPEALVGDVLQLWQDAGLTRPWNDPHADLLRALRGSASTVLAARDDDGALLGTAMVGHDGHRGWVFYLAVADDQRGRGVGRSLLRACEAWVGARGVPKIQLMVRNSNTDVIAFYTSLGYEVGDVVVLGRRLD